MAKKLTALRLDSLKTEGFFSDPECTGLYVQVSFKRHGTDYSAKHGITRSWVYRYRSPLTKKSRCMGLGSCDCYTIAEAREQARFARKLVTGGDDPIEYRNAKNAAKIQSAIREKASTMTFGACVAQYLETKTQDFKNDKHRAQWHETLGRAVASFGDMNVSLVDTPTVTKFLSPIWDKTPETASRLRSRIESVLDWAAVHKFRTGENPARWAGNLEHVFSARRKVEHHSAMPFAELPAFMIALRGRNSVSARALEFLILTAARTGEVIGATWNEIDTEAKTWTVPAERMKAGKEHVVPLSNAALALLAGLDRDSEYVFHGATGKPLSNMAMLELLKGMDANGYTPHGMRSSFRDWAGDRGDFDRESVEFSLAHQLPDKVEAAYRRGTSLGKRVRLMQAWSNYLDKVHTADNIVSLRA